MLRNITMYLIKRQASQYKKSKNIQPGVFI